MSIMNFKMNAKKRLRLNKYERSLCELDSGKQFNRGQAREIRRITADLIAEDFKHNKPGFSLGFCLLSDGVSRKMKLKK